MPSQNKSEERSALRRDKSGIAIDGGSRVNGVINTPITSDSWASVVMPSTRNCKQLILHERSGDPFIISTESDGDPYFSIPTNTILRLSIAADASQRLFYAKKAAGSGTLEVLLID